MADATLLHLSPFPCNRTRNRTIKVDIGGTQVSNLLRPCSSVIEDHEETPITKRQGSLFGQGTEEFFNFILFQIMSLRRRSAF